jgi:MtN3 and saliva related transmembrane protein
MTAADIPQDALGFAAGALTTIAFIPQVYRIVKTRSAHDISWLMFGLFSVGIGLWLWYGVRAGAWPLIVANTITLTLAVTILYLKWRYGRDPDPTQTAPTGGAAPTRE